MPLIIEIFLSTFFNCAFLIFNLLFKFSTIKSIKDKIIFALNKKTPDHSGVFYLVLLVLINIYRLLSNNKHAQ